MKEKHKILTYIVNGTFYRNKDRREDDLIQIYKEFQNESNQVSRKQAFSYFKSTIEVLLESHNLKFENYKQAEKDLKEFYTSEKIDIHPKLGLNIGSSDIDKIITISFSELAKPSHTTKTGIKYYDDAKIISAFGYDTESLKDYIYKNLEIENNLILK